jgi:hypothetical protein
LVCGFDGQGGQEYATPDNGFWVADGDLEGFAHAVAKALEVGLAREAPRDAALASLSSRVDAVGAAVMQANSRMAELSRRSDTERLTRSVEHLEKLVLSLSPRVVAMSGSGGGGGGGSAAARHSGAAAATEQWSSSAAATAAAATSLLASAPGSGLATTAAVEALGSALLQHTRLVDDSFSLLQEQQKELAAAVGALTASVAELARGSARSAQQSEAAAHAHSAAAYAAEALQQQRYAAASSASASSSARGSSVTPSSISLSQQLGLQQAKPSLFSPLSAAAEGGSYGGSSARNAAEPSSSSSRSQSVPPAASNAAAAHLRDKSAALYAELSRASGMDLYRSVSVEGAAQRLPPSIRARPEVVAILDKLRALQEHAAARQAASSSSLLMPQRASSPGRQQASPERLLPSLQLPEGGRYAYGAGGGSSSSFSRSASPSRAE